MGNLALAAPWPSLADCQLPPLLHCITMHHSVQGHHLSTSKSPLASPDLSRLNPAAAWVVGSTIILSGGPDPILTGTMLGVCPP